MLTTIIRGGEYLEELARLATLTAAPVQPEPTTVPQPQPEPVKEVK